MDSVRSPEQIREKGKMEIHKFHPKHTWGQVNEFLSFFRLVFYLYPPPEIIEFFGSNVIPQFFAYLTSQISTFQIFRNTSHFFPVDLTKISDFFLI